MGDNTELYRKAFRSNVKVWFYSALATLIGGGASSVSVAFSAILIDPSKFNLNDGLSKTLRLMGTCFIVNGAVSLFAYLKQSPLPALSSKASVTQTIITETPNQTKVQQTVVEKKDQK